MRKRPRPDRIAAILRQVRAVLLARLNIDPACRTGGIGLTTDDRWKAVQEDPVSIEQLRMSDLEGGRLKHLVAELAPDRRMLQEAFGINMTAAAPSSPSCGRSSASRGAAPVAIRPWMAPVS
jgi:hypothetical protein